MSNFYVNYKTLLAKFEEEIICNKSGIKIVSSNIIKKLQQKVNIEFNFPL